MKQVAVEVSVRQLEIARTIAVLALRALMVQLSRSEIAGEVTAAHAQ